MWIWCLNSYLCVGVRDKNICMNLVESSVLLSHFFVCCSSSNFYVQFCCFYVPAQQDIREGSCLLCAMLGVWNPRFAGWPRRSGGDFCMLNCRAAPVRCPLCLYCVQPCVLAGHRTTRGDADRTTGPLQWHTIIRHVFCSFMEKTSHRSSPRAPPLLCCRIPISEVQSRRQIR